MCVYMCVYTHTYRLCTIFCICVSFYNKMIKKCLKRKEALVMGSYS